MAQSRQRRSTPMSPLSSAFLRVALLLGFVSLSGSHAIASEAAGPGSSSPAVAAGLPPLPAPLGVPTPAAETSAPYSPQPILPGGVVIPLYPPNSPYLKPDRVHEAEVYSMGAPGEIAYIIHIHNPSIEFHPGNGSLNTGVAVVLAAGGGHNTLNVGGEGADFVHFFANHGVNTVILRNRLRSDGYEPKTDGVNDALQAIKLVRAHAKEWKLDPNKIGIMGFSAGAELAAATTLVWPEFDQKNDMPANPLAKTSSRPDFAGIIYPGPSLFARGGKPVIPRDTPPSFITSAGWGDWIHAVWATEYFTAMLNDGVPNVEMHIYARGHHPGDKVGPDEPPSTGGLTNRGFIAYGKWPDRFIDWFRDLGFLGKPGVETQAAKDVAANLNRPKRSATWTPPHAKSATTTASAAGAQMPSAAKAPQ